MNVVASYYLMLRLVAILMLTVTTSWVVSFASGQDAIDVQAPDLEALIPQSFGEWSVSPLTTIVRPTEEVTESGMSVLYRAYAHENGQIVALAVAYGMARGDAVRLHQPEVCYRAQGYAVRREDTAPSTGMLKVVRLSASNGLRLESASYWLRTGDSIVTNAAAYQFSNIRAGFGRSADSTLVRVSSPGAATGQAFSLHDQFIEDLMGALSSDVRIILTGTGIAEDDQV